MKIDTTEMPVKARLNMLGKTQRWMLEQLHNTGFPNLTEPVLSNINVGAYTVGCASDVLKAEDNILSKVEKETS